MNEIKFSQNFITSNKNIYIIISKINLRETDCILEIGTGKGHLSKALASKANYIVSVELDESLYQYSLIKLKDLKNLKIINYDFLELNLYQYSKYIIIGNIPYNISTQIIKKIVFNSSIEKSYLIVEYGFALRLNDYTRHLGLSILMDVEIEILMKIPNSYFHPKPKRNSALISLTRLSNLMCDNKREQYHLFIKYFLKKEYDKLFTKNQFRQALRYANVNDVDKFSREEIISLYNSYLLFKK